jgi:cytochrome c-type biogenesis protein CcmF
MIPEIGHYAFILALAVALVQSTIPLIGARNGDIVLMDVAAKTAFAQFALMAISFGALSAAYIQSDFSVQSVYENSH